MMFLDESCHIIDNAIFTFCFLNHRVFEVGSIARRPKELVVCSKAQQLATVLTYPIGRSCGDCHHRNCRKMCLQNVKLRVVWSKIVSFTKIQKTTVSSNDDSISSVVGVRLTPLACTMTFINYKTP
jgi:hypothetical protein